MILLASLPNVHAEQNDKHSCRCGPEACRNEHVAHGSGRNDNKNHFEPFQDDRFEGCGDGNYVQVRGGGGTIRSQRIGLFYENCFFIMEANNAGRAKNSFSKPPHA